MKTIFAHDHRFIPHDGSVFSESQFDSELWPRYLAHFDQLVVTARQGELPKGKILHDLVISSRNNVNFEFIPNLSSPVGQLRYRQQALEILSKSIADADAVVARLPSEIGLLAIDCAKKMDKPWAVEVVGCPWDGLWNYGNWQGKLYAPVLTWRMKQAVSQAKFALYVTDHFLQQRYPAPGSETTNCSDVEIAPLSEHVLTTRLDKINSVKKDKLTFGLIGTLKGKFKGIQTVLSALKNVRNKLPPCEFRVLGGGDSAAWRQLARKLKVDDITHFDGTLSPGEPVFEWLDQVDIYLQPSFKEGLPRALIEAMSRGCPCIASNVAGIPELLDQHNLINPEDTKYLGQLLIRAATDKAWQIEQAKKNWQRAGDYSSDILDSRRNNFWRRFAEYVSSHQFN